MPAAASRVSKAAEPSLSVRLTHPSGRMHPSSATRALWVPSSSCTSSTTISGVPWGNVLSFSDSSAGPARTTSAFAACTARIVAWTVSPPDQKAGRLSIFKKAGILFRGWLQATVFSLPHGAGAALSHGARARGAGGLRAPPPAGPRSVARGEEVRPDIYRSASTYNYAGRIPWYRTCEYGTVHGVWKRASDPRRTVCA
jgi:hypothetical protein